MDMRDYSNVDYSFETGEGIIVKEISDLKAGTYDVNVTYPGDSGSSKGTVFGLTVNETSLLDSLNLKDSVR